MFFNPAGFDRFFDLGYSVGLDFADDGRAFVPLDFDGDGDLDISALSLQGLRLMENRLPREGRHFARLRLRATRSQHHALGANVKLEVDGVRQQDYVKGTAGFQTQVPLDLHFGLGATQAKTIDRIEIRWPSGAVESYRDLPIDRLLLFTEGRRPQSLPLPAWPVEGQPRVPNTYDLSASALRVEGGEAPLATRGAPAVINFWAPWCKPCQEELPTLRMLSDRYRGKATFVGVSVETKDQSEVRRAIRDHGLSYPQFYGNDRLLASFFGGDGEAQLPSTFVFDSRGSIRRAFHRPIQAQDLDVLLDSFQDGEVPASYLAVLGSNAGAQGRVQDARRYYEEALAAEPGHVLATVGLGSIAAAEGKLDEAAALLTVATEKDPWLPLAWLRLAMVYAARGDAEKATSTCRRWMDTHPKDSHCLVTVGTTLFGSGHPAQAEKALAAAVEVSPDAVEAWVGLGKVRLHLGRGDATEALRKALRLKPGHPEAARLLAMPR